MSKIDPKLLRLRIETSPRWTQTVLSNFDLFLNDHAQAEKKASGMALSMLSHYPDRTDLVREMIDLSIEELAHFREVIKLMQARGLQLGHDEKDPYVNQIRQHINKGDSEMYLLDRLLTGAIIEARGCERFGLIGAAHSEPELSSFYQLIAESEAKHHLLFITLAERYIDSKKVETRLNEWLDIEASIVQSLPLRAALH
ncbi:MAG: tRNA-(ms[2]io[6]A)-hydroxylase [Pseudohongiellaceae bacterium]|jgi:tRNA-(ms[2]io[6]A)-hydroxylase